VIGEPTLETVAIRPGLCFPAAFAGLGPGGARPSGLRTMVLICVSAGTAMLLADWLLTLQRLRRLETVLRRRS
jgi:hypothetical protein